MQVEVESQAEGWGEGGYIPLTIVIETELENVVDIRPGMPAMLNFIERVLRKWIRLVLMRPHHDRGLTALKLSTATI